MGAKENNTQPHTRALKISRLTRTRSNVSHGRRFERNAFVRGGPPTFYALAFLNGRDRAARHTGERVTSRYVHAPEFTTKRRSKLPRGTARQTRPTIRESSTKRDTPEKREAPSCIQTRLLRTLQGPIFVSSEQTRTISEGLFRLQKYSRHNGRPTEKKGCSSIANQPHMNTYETR